VVVLGTLRRTTSTGLVTFSTTLEDSGAVAVQTGTLQLGGGGSSSGPFTVAAGATLDFAGGTHSLSAAATVSGAGAVQVSGGTVSAGGAWTLAAVQVTAGAVTLTGGYSVSGTTTVSGGTANFSSVAAQTSGALTQSGGTIGGSGLLTVAGAFPWSGGSLSGGGGTLRVSGALSVSGSGAGRQLNTYTLEAGGGGTWSTTTAAMNSGSGGTLRVLAGQTLDVTGDFGVLFNQGGASSRVVVLGTLRRTTSTGLVTFSTTLEDSGAVAVQTGTLQLGGGGNSSGPFTVAAGATLDFAGGTHSLSAAATVSGAGAVQVSAGIVNYSGTMSIGTLSVTGGSFVMGGNTIAVTGNFSTSGSGTLTMANAFDSLDINGNASFGGSTSTLNAGVIRLAGNFAQTGSTSFRGLAQSAAVAHRVRIVGGNSTINFADPVNSFFRRLLVAKNAGTSATITSDVRTTFFSMAGGTYSMNGSAGPPMTRLIADTVAGASSGSVSLQSPLVLVVNAALVDSNVINVDTVVFAGSGQNILTTAPGGAFGNYTYRSLRVAQTSGTATIGQATLNMTNDLVVSSGTLNLSGRRVGVTGNFSTVGTGALQMQNVADSLGVGGNASFGGGASTLMNNGVITLNGSFSQSGATNAFAPTVGSQHRVSLRGTTSQNISFANPAAAQSSFSVLDVQSGTARNIVLQTDAVVDSLAAVGGPANVNIISAGTTQRLRVKALRVISSTQSPLVAPAVLELTQFPNVDSIFAAGRGVSPDTTVFLPGVTTFPDGTPMRYKSVRIANNAVMSYSTGGFADSLVGDLVIDGTSTLALTGGSLTVFGKLRTISSGILRMQTAGTQLTVRDSAQFGGGSTNGQLTNGVLQLRGHFVQGGGNTAAFSATNAHQTEFIGNPTGAGVVQTVSMANPGTGATLSRFNQLRLTRAAAGTSLNVKLNLLTNAQAALVVDTSTGQNDSILGTGTVTLTTDSIQLQNTVFNNAPLVLSSNNAFILANTLRFENMNSTVTYFTVNRNGASTSTITGMNFATVPTGAGRYFAVNQAAAGAVYSLTFNGTLNPSTGAAVSGLYTRTGPTLPTVVWAGVTNP
jgi:hypothetical protein